MNRQEAFDIARESLELAQDLAGHAVLRDPAMLKDNLSYEDLIDELKVSHQAFVKATKAAYALDKKITDWADEYPLVEKEKK